MRGSGLAAILFLGGDKMVATAGPAPAGGLGGSSGSSGSTGSTGILIGDRLYSAVFLTIDNSLIPADKLSPTPSMQDGLALEAESDLRILGCEQIQAAGILLRLPQVAMATAQVLFQRFFFSKSFVKHSFEIVAMACINLASKIEEAPRRVRDVINVFHHLRQLRGKRSPTPLILDQNYINTKNQVIKAERRILKELGFCVHVKHPHKIIFMYLQVLECERNQTLVQTAWNYMNDSLRTSAFVRFKPETIACACIYLAARALQIVLPNRPHWFVVFGATEEEIQDICITTLKLYTQKKPNYEHVEKEVEKRKVALQEAKLKAKGLNPDGTPALSTVGGFSPGSKSCSPREIKTEDKTPGIQNPKPIKKELEERQMNANKSPYNGLRKENKPIRNSRSISRSRSRTRSRSHSPRRHYTRRSRSGTCSSRSRSRSHSHSASPRHRHNHTSPHLKPKPQREEAKMAVRHGHKRKKSRSRSKSPDGCDPAKRRRHDKEHQRDRHERSRSYERVHKGKHHSTAHSAHGRHHR